MRQRRFLRLFPLLLVAIPALAQEAAKAAAAPAPPGPPASSQPAAPELLKKALGAYRTGKFDAAIENYQAALVQDPKSADAYAGLTRTYLKQEKVAPAADTATKGVAAIDAPVTRAALGEVYFRQAKMVEAEKEFIKSIDVVNPDAHGYLGLARLYTSYSLYARAKTMLDKAHNLAPDDPDVQRRWIRTLPRSEQIQWLTKYLAGPTNDDIETRLGLAAFLAYLQEREKQPHASCKLATPIASTEAELKALLTDPTHMQGYGLTVKVNGQSSKLLLDTGAGGLLINSRLAKKAGIEQVHTTEIGGIGDQGAVKGYIGYAKSIKVGELEFTDCLVAVSDKRSVAHDDGLIGADVFSHYLVSLDFAGGKLRLQELPKRPGQQEGPATLSTEEDEGSPSEETKADASQPGSDKSEKKEPAAEKKEPAANRGPYDRYVAPEMQGYTKIFRFGHDLLIPTRVGNSAPKLFLIDTGSMFNNISPEAAREVTKVRTDDEMKVEGISGAVNKVYSADKAVLQFAHFRQENQDLIAMDMSWISNSDGIEVSGILGFVTLRFMIVKIDYRDGLVDFEYKPPPGLR